MCMFMYLWFWTSLGSLPISFCVCVYLMSLPCDMSTCFFPVLSPDAHRALELLEDYHTRLTKPQDRPLKTAIERVIRIFKSRLFQALLGKLFESVCVGTNRESVSINGSGLRFPFIWSSRSVSCSSFHWSELFMSACGHAWSQMSDCLISVHVTVTESGCQGEKIWRAEVL